jgi:hypothetical protein
MVDVQWKAYCNDSEISDYQIPDLDWVRLDLRRGLCSAELDEDDERAGEAREWTVSLGSWIPVVRIGWAV